MHNSVQVNDNFTMVYSAGRDKHVWATSIRDPDNRVLICEEKAPVLKVRLRILLHLKSMKFIVNGKR